MPTLDTLIAQLTLEEKASLCSGHDFWSTKAIERLAIPAMRLSDGPHGLRVPAGDDHLGLTHSKPATCFPTAAGLACSWNPALVEEMGRALGDEARAEGLHVVLGPGANIKRSPLCGRNFEYFSEDPLLSSRLAAAHIRGVQSRGVGASLKHFAANNQEHRRMSVNAVIDERSLREIYLASFESAVKEAQPWTVMCAYNRLNGELCAEHPYLLTDILRNEWGFEGFVVSDWGAVNERVAGLAAGLELEMPPGGEARDRQIVAAVREGALDEAILDRAVARLLAVTLRVRDNEDDSVGVDHEAHHQLARRVARESMVLLKNDNALLPLAANAEVALIGEFAKRPRYQGGGSSHVNATRVASLYEALDSRLGERLHYAQGFAIDRDDIDSALQQEAVAQAREAGVAVLCLGLPERIESEGYDREHLDLPPNQIALIEAVRSVQTNTLVVLASGAPIVMPWVEHADAILAGYLGGQACGEALADLLLGDVSPCGKLAETFPQRLADTPCYLNFPGEGDRVRYGEGIFVGYRYYDSAEVAPLFPFGHGLSYSRFDYTDLELSRDTFSGEDELTVRLSLTNSGGVEASEVVQLYVSDATRTIPVAEQTLRAFDKIALRPGATQHIAFTLRRRDFCFYDAAHGDWRLPSGTFEIRIGASSQDIRLVAPFEVAGDPVMLPPLDRNTLLGDLLVSDAAVAVLREQLADIADELPMIDPIMGREGDGGMMEAMSRYLPLRALVSFSSFTEAQLDQLLTALRAVR
ncbi:glycoside hydrolase family 3 C-terminal domain-containing protein [Kushneria aurantia]|uniref:Glycoside hydrolase family 3 C-terminal domain-containing protein n=1 Tax=Kushneria aurantia TaxID=504092 RepID=A0ABV6G3X5_9GAMM|nr:glycoside hydrolase family 3 C-terminal domain-containing protein [Kushneria aurantia]